MPNASAWMSAAILGGIVLSIGDSVRMVILPVTGTDMGSKEGSAVNLIIRFVKVMQILRQ
jgi:hypothetical protein